MTHFFANPPVLPPRYIFSMTPTTFSVAIEEPRKVGEALVEFFEQADASIEKVNFGKFLIQVRLTSKDCIWCRARVRIYSKGVGDFLVEFKRCEGDDAIFFQAYAKAYNFLKERIDGVGEHSQGACFVHLTREEQSASEPLQQTLDLVSSDQAELCALAASRLRNMALDESRVHDLCDAAVVEALEKLLEGGCLSQKYPAATALLELAKRPEGIVLISQAHISKKIYEMLQSGVEDGVVGKKLAEVLSLVLGFTESAWIERFALSDRAH